MWWKKLRSERDFFVCFFFMFVCFFLKRRMIILNNLDTKVKIIGKSSVDFISFFWFCQHLGGEFCSAGPIWGFCSKIWLFDRILLQKLSQRKILITFFFNSLLGGGEEALRGSTNFYIFSHEILQLEPEGCSKNLNFNSG